MICAPVYGERRGLSTGIYVGSEEGLERESSVLCDALVGLEKSRLTQYVGSLSFQKLTELEAALRIALDVEGLET